MVKVYFSMQMVKFMKGIGLRVKNMDMGDTYIEIKIAMKVNFWRIKNMGMENIFGTKHSKHIKDYFSKIKFTSIHQIIIIEDEFS